MSTTCRRACADEDVRKIMGGNLARIMRVEVPVGAVA